MTEPVVPLAGYDLPIRPQAGPRRYDPRVGADRTAWLEMIGDRGANALRYWLGPGAVPVDAVMRGLQYTDAGDYVEAGEASRDVWNNPSFNNALRLGTAAAAMAVPFVGARMADDLARWADDFAGDEEGALTLYRGTNNSGEKISGGIGEGYLFASPHEDVARLYGDTIEKMELPDSARVLREGTKEFAEVTGRKRGQLLRTMRAGENLKTAADDAISAAKAAGYDAVEFNSMRDMGIAIINPSVVSRADPAAERGQQIMDLLTSGRASEVTDDMLDMGDPVQNARLNMYLYDNYDLPMDEASRMARADARWPVDAYHGTAGGDYTEFREGSSPSLPVDGAIWSTTTPDGGANHIAESRMMSAGQGDGRVLPVRLNTGNNMAVDAAGAHAVDVRGAKDAATQGFDSVTLENVREFGDPQLTDSIAVFDPRNIRSRFARFDPRLAHLRNLSAGVGGVGMYNALTPEDQRKEEIRNYLRGYQ